MPARINRMLGTLHRRDPGTRTQAQPVAGLAIILRQPADGARVTVELHAAAAAIAANMRRGSG